MTKEEEKRYHHPNLKEALIQEAFIMLKECGLEAITLRELTKRLGTSRSAIYRHFSNKEDLIKHVILTGFELLDVGLEPIFSNTKTSLIEKFEQMGSIYITFAVENPDLYRVLFGPKHMKEREEVCEDEKPELYQLKNNNSNLQELDKMESNGFHKLVVLIVKAQEEGIFIKSDPFKLSIFIWSSLHGLSSLIIDGHTFGGYNAKELYETNFKTLLNGLLA